MTTGGLQLSCLLIVHVECCAYGTVGDETDVSVPNFEPPNSDQERATRAALDGTFTMIQGPPGTFTICYVVCR